MTARESTLPPTSAPVTTARTLALHALSLVLPLSATAFLITGPHPWWGALPWSLVIVAVVLLDQRSPGDRRAPAAGLPALPFDALLIALSLLHFVNIALAVRLMGVSGALSVDALIAVLLVGASAGWSAIVVAHELIHRRSRALQLLGRALLVTVLYEHFSTEHVRGHHLRLGTDEDPATARFGESLRAFMRRTVPAQLRSAWTIEEARLGLTGTAWYDPRWLRSRVVQGLVVEAALLGAIAVMGSVDAAIVFVLQAAFAVSLLEVVNYFEHWGLRRAERKVRPVDSWDTDSWFTLHALVGLSRHADHHAYAARPYQDLRHWEGSPKLPFGYLGMVVLAIGDNERCRRLMTEELARKKLGPFAGDAARI